MRKLKAKRMRAQMTVSNLNMKMKKTKMGKGMEVALNKINIRLVKKTSHLERP